jgi:tripartite ATP-independent transporter DctP family solute receptor
MKFRKHSRAVVAFTAVALLVAACGGDNGDAPAAPAPAPTDSSTPDEVNPDVTLRAAHAQPPDHPFQVCGYDVMTAYFEANPDSGITLDVFGGSQLGSNEETMEQVRAGNLDMTIPGLGSLTIFDRRIGAMETAFAFEDFDHVQEIFDGEIGQSLILPLRDEFNTRIVGPLWKLGDRHLTGNEVITSPDQLAGKTIRTQDQPASRATGRALGANPVPINFSELYLALSQGVVDHQENPITQINAINLNEVQDYVMLTGHIVNVTILIVAESTYQSLTESQQEHLETAAAQAAARVLECIDEGEQETVARWAADGSMTVVPQSEIDMDAFRANAEDVYLNDPELGPLWGELYLEIRATR